jgi:hypothetical protein
LHLHRFVAVGLSAAISVPRRPMKRKTRYIMPVAKSTWIG